MKKVKLTHGKYALVDNQDFEWLNQWKWWLDYRGYAVRDIGGRKNKNRWVACIKINYKKIHLGRYQKLDDAIKARKKAEELHCV